jgi:hypothetical protein
VCEWVGEWVRVCGEREWVSGCEFVVCVCESVWVSGCEFVVCVGERESGCEFVVCERVCVGEWVRVCGV